MLKKLLCILGVCVAALLFAELVLALWHPAPVSRDLLGRDFRQQMHPEGEPFYEEMEVCDGLQCFELYDWIPSRKGSESLLGGFHADYRINSLRMRGPESKVRQSVTGKKMLIVGDSHVFGTGVQEEETFSHILENSMVTDGRSHLVHNAGVPGYSTIEQYFKMVSFLEKECVDVVIVGAFVIDSIVFGETGNDLVGNLRYDTQNQVIFIEAEFDEKKRLAFLSDHSHFYNHLASVYNKTRGVKTYEDQLRENLHVETPDLNNGWKATYRYLQMIKDYSAEKCGAKTIVFYIPHLYSVLVAETLTEQKLKKSGLPVVSPRDIFFEKVRDKPQEYLVPRDGHWNANAHTIFADVLLNFLKENKYLEA